MQSTNELIINSKNTNLLNELKQSLKQCKSFYFSVAFINYSGIQLLLDTLKEVEDKGVIRKNNNNYLFKLYRTKGFRENSRI